MALYDVRIRGRWVPVIRRQDWPKTSLLYPDDAEFAVATLGSYSRHDEPRQTYDKYGVFPVILAFDVHLNNGARPSVLYDVLATVRCGTTIDGHQQEAIRVVNTSTGAVLTVPLDGTSAKAAWEYLQNTPFAVALASEQPLTTLTAAELETVFADLHGECCVMWGDDRAALYSIQSPPRRAEACAAWQRSKHECFRRTWIAALRGLMTETACSGVF
jgi:hypothetical protein